MIRCARGVSLSSIQHANHSTTNINGRTDICRTLCIYCSLFEETGAFYNSVIALQSFLENVTSDCRSAVESEQNWTLLVAIGIGQLVPTINLNTVQLYSRLCSQEKSPSTYDTAFLNHFYRATQLC